MEPKKKLSTADPIFSRSHEDDGWDKPLTDEDKLNIPVLEKLPTNEFILDKFLADEDDETEAHKSNSKRSSHADISSKESKRSGPTASAKSVRSVPVNEELRKTPDYAETVLDTSETYFPYDETGQKAYENACRKYSALPSSSFHKKLAYATEINLRHYGIGPRGATAMAIPMVINTRVTSLSFKNNDLGAVGITNITKMMMENTTVTDLDLSDNNLRTFGAILVAKMLKENRSLRKLDLSSNNFSDGDAKILAEVIEDHDNLKFLNLSKNEFGEQSGHIFKTMLAENGVLQEVDLSWNQIRLKGAVEFATGFMENIGLKKLDVSWNGLGDEGAVVVGRHLKSNGSIVDLNLASNRVQAEGFLMICKGLCDNDELQVLRLGRNPITEEAALTGLEVIKAADSFSLQTLDLADITFSSKVGDKIKEVQEKHPSFQCTYGYSDSYGKRKLKKYDVVEEALLAMQAYLVENDMKIVDLFSRFDVDGSMSVTYDEFKEGLKDAKIPLTPFQVEKLIEELDKDGDGEIDFSELVLGTEKLEAKADS